MSQFQNLNELIKRCSFCSICQKPRDIGIVFGPEEFFVLDSFINKNEILTLNTIYRYSSIPEEELKDGEPRSHIKYNISFVISTVENSYKLNITGPITEVSNEVFCHQSKNPWPYFFIEGKCKECSSYITSKDINLNFLEERINVVSVEREIFNLCKTDIKYRLIYDFDENIMYAQKIIPKVRKKYTVYVKKGKSIKLPLYMFDFTDETKVLSKLKTYITFS